MKRLLAPLLAMVMCLSLVACGGGTDTPSTNDDGGNNVTHENASGTADNTGHASELTQLLCEKNVWYGMRHNKGSEEEFTFFEDGHFEKSGSSFTWTLKEYLPDATEFLTNYAFQTTPNYDAARGLYVTNEFLLGYDTDGNLLLYWRDYFCYNESQYELVEITLDNWQEYFELELVVDEWRNAAGELAAFEPEMRFHLKENRKSIAKEMDIVFEYTCTDGYLCRFTYNTDTGELIEGEKVGEATEPLLQETCEMNHIDADVVLFGGAELLVDLNGNIASNTAVMYSTVEILSIQGTIRVAK